MIVLFVLKEMIFLRILCYINNCYATVFLKHPTLVYYYKSLDIHLILFYIYILYYRKWASKQLQKVYLCQNFINLNSYNLQSFWNFIITLIQFYVKPFLWLSRWGLVSIDYNYIFLFFIFYFICQICAVIPSLAGAYSYLRKVYYYYYYYKDNIDISCRELKRLSLANKS